MLLSIPFDRSFLLIHANLSMLKLLLIQMDLIRYAEIS